MAVCTDLDDGAAVYTAAGGPESPRCHWFYGICMETPTHHITGPVPDDGAAETATYCARHYVLTLARHLEVHGPTCEHGGVEQHISTYGEFA